MHTAVRSSIFNRNMFLGFEDAFKMLDHYASKSEYPPYNIERVSDDKYTLELAVAGFKKEDIDISIEKNTLKNLIGGRVGPADDGECAVSLFVAIHPLPGILSTVGPDHPAFAMLPVLMPVADISGARRPGERSRTLALAARPGTFVHVTAGPSECTLTVGQTEFTFALIRRYLYAL